MECQVCRTSRVPCQNCKKSSRGERKPRLTLFNKIAIEQYSSIYDKSFNQPIEVSPTVMSQIFHMNNLRTTVQIDALASRIMYYLIRIIGNDDLNTMCTHLFHDICCNILLLRAALNWPQLPVGTRDHVVWNRISVGRRHAEDLVGEFFDKCFDLVNKCIDLKVDNTERDLLFALLALDNNHVENNDNIELVFRNYEWDYYGNFDQKRWRKVLDVYLLTIAISRYFGNEFLSSPLVQDFNGFQVTQQDMEIITSLLYT